MKKIILLLCIIAISLSGCTVMEKHQVEKTADTYWTHIEKGEWIQAVAMMDVQTSLSDKMDTVIDDAKTKKLILNEIDQTMRFTLSKMYKSHTIVSVSLNDKQTQAKVKVKVRYIKPDVDTLKNQLYIDVLPYLMNQGDIPSIGERCRKDIQTSLKEGKVVTKTETMTLIKKKGDWLVQPPENQSVWKVLNASALVDNARFSNSLADIL